MLLLQMRKEPVYFVYILASRSLNLYIGVTNHLSRRVEEHREGSASVFTRTYNINRLVYYESFRYINSAIRREKVLKSWLRKRKLQLIRSVNPAWIDLYEELGKPITKPKI